MSTIKKYCVCLFGILLSALGMVLFYNSGFGSDPVSVFVDGLHYSLNLSYGTALNYFNLGIMLLALILAFQNIQVGMILYLLLSGIFVNMFENLIQSMNLSCSSLQRILLLFTGVVVANMGTGILISSGLGAGTWDTVLLVITQKFHTQYRYIRFASDSFFIITGFLLGGIVGAGTFLSLMVAGSFVDFFQNISDRTIMRTEDSSQNL